MTLALKKILSERGIKQSALADELEISRGYMSLLLTGKRAPSPALLERLADYLDLPIGSLFDGEEDARGSIGRSSIKHLRIPMPQIHAALRALDIRGHSVDLMEMTETLAGFNLEEDDRVFVDREYELQINDLVVLELLLEGKLWRRTVVRYVKPWFVTHSNNEPALHSDRKELRVLGKVIAATRTYPKDLDNSQRIPRPLTREPSI
jgi:transcriptional regulator with XRE-family HTH domain